MRRTHDGLSDGFFSNRDLGHLITSRSPADLISLIWLHCCIINLDIKRPLISGPREHDPSNLRLRMPSGRAWRALPCPGAPSRGSRRRHAQRTGLDFASGTFELVGCDARASKSSPTVFASAFSAGSKLQPLRILLHLPTPALLPVSLRRRTGPGAVPTHTSAAQAVPGLVPAGCLCRAAAYQAPGEGRWPQHGGRAQQAALLVRGRRARLLRRARGALLLRPPGAGHELVSVERRASSVERRARRPKERGRSIDSRPWEGAIPGEASAACKMADVLTRVRFFLQRTVDRTRTRRARRDQTLAGHAGANQSVQVRRGASAHETANGFLASRCSQTLLFSARRLSSLAPPIFLASTRTELSGKRLTACVRYTGLATRGTASTAAVSLPASYTHTYTLRADRRPGADASSPEPTSRPDSPDSARRELGLVFEGWDVDWWLAEQGRRRESGEAPLS